MKYNSKIITLGALALLLTGTFVSLVSADKEHKGGWIQSGSVVKYIDNNDSQTNVDINKNGAVTLRGAKIVSISGNLITVTSTLGNSVLTWTGNIDSTTKLEAKNGKTVLVTDMGVGDIVTVKGTMNSGSGLNFKATLIRDVSKAYVPVVTNTKQIFEGTLTVQPGTTVPTALTINIGNSPQVVNISATTILLNKNWLPVGLGTFLNGDGIRVFGFIPSGNTTVTGLVVRDTTR